MYILLTAWHDIIHVHDTLLLIGQACTCPKDLCIFISAFSACSFCKIMEIHYWPRQVSLSENFWPGSSCMLSNTYRELIFLSFLYRCRANAHIKHHEGFSPYMIFKSHTTARQTVFRWWWQSRSRISMSASTLDRNARTSILVQPNAFPKVT